jgi:hypothetical protein
LLYKTEKNEFAVIAQSRIAALSGQVYAGVPEVLAGLTATVFVGNALLRETSFMAHGPAPSDDTGCARRTFLASPPATPEPSSAPEYQPKQVFPSVNGSLSAMNNEATSQA